MKIYIAGPMSGIEAYNFPAFNAAQERLEVEGWQVFNPAKKDEEIEVHKSPSFKTGDAEALMKEGFNFRNVYTWDTNRVIESDAIYMLKGWEHSPGAVGEWGLAVVMQVKYPEYKIIYEN